MPSHDSIAILLAEDEVGAREMSAIILEAEGYRVLTATNGSVAYNMLRNDFSIDLLISDINMPGGMDGIALVERLHDEQRDRPVVILTSGHDRGSFEDFPDNAGFLAKPYDRRGLLDAVRAALPEGSPSH